MGNATLVDIFRAEEESCLLGTDAMRDGVDVPGRALRLVVFEKVPWPRPDILHRERRVHLSDGDPKGYDDRIARLRLRQAFGRLIRRATDRGVFVLLDRQTPTRLLSAFPAGVVVRRVGLAQAVSGNPRLPGPAAAGADLRPDSRGRLISCRLNWSRRFAQVRCRAFSVQIDAPQSFNLMFDRVIHGFGDSTCADHARRTHMDAPMRSRETLEAPEALVLTMVLVAAADSGMTDQEIGVMSGQVQTLPIFRDFTTEGLVEATNAAVRLLGEEDGLKHAGRLMRGALSTRLRETAYALACEVVAADGSPSCGRWTCWSSCGTSLHLDP